MTSLVQKIVVDSDRDKFAMTQNARERCCWHSNIWPTGWFTPHQSIIKLQRHTEVYEETFDVNIKIAQTTQNSWNFNIVGKSSLLKWRKCKLRRLFGRFRTLICRLAHKSSFSARSATVSAKRDRTSAEREARASERAKARRSCRVLPHQTRKPCERLWESLSYLKTARHVPKSGVSRIIRGSCQHWLFLRPLETGTAILRVHPNHLKVQPLAM